ncbi:hypothetical protein AHS81_24105 [Salmonella enterica]|nr:hypothetical protein [Salmonella enterica]
MPNMLQNSTNSLRQKFRRFRHRTPHSEYGGLWPVYVRIIPKHGRHYYILTSPGEVSDSWMLLLQSASGQQVKCLCRMSQLDTVRINNLLMRADELGKMRYTLEGLAMELSHSSL